MVIGRGNVHPSVTLKINNQQSIIVTHPSMCVLPPEEYTAWQITVQKSALRDG